MTPGQVRVLGYVASGLVWTSGGRFRSASGQALTRDCEQLAYGGYIVAGETGLDDERLVELTDAGRRVLGYGPHGVTA